MSEWKGNKIKQNRKITLSDLNNSFPNDQAKEMSKGGMFFSKEEATNFSSAVKLADIVCSMIRSPIGMSSSLVVILLAMRRIVSKSQYLDIWDIRPGRRLDAFIIASGSSGKIANANKRAAVIGKASINICLSNLIRDVVAVRFLSARYSRLFVSLKGNEEQ